MWKTLSSIYWWWYHPSYSEYSVQPPPSPPFLKIFYQSIHPLIALCLFSSVIIMICLTHSYAAWSTEAVCSDPSDILRYFLLHPMGVSDESDGKMCVFCYLLIPLDIPGYFQLLLLYLVLWWGVGVVDCTDSYN